MHLLALPHRPSPLLRRRPLPRFSSRYPPISYRRPLSKFSSRSVISPPISYSKDGDQYQGWDFRGMDSDFQGWGSPNPPPLLRARADPFSVSNVLSELIAYPFQWVVLCLKMYNKDKGEALEAMGKRLRDGHMKEDMKRMEFYSHRSNDREMMKSMLADLSWSDPLDREEMELQLINFVNVYARRIMNFIEKDQATLLNTCNSLLRLGNPKDRLVGLEILKIYSQK